MMPHLPHQRFGNGSASEAIQLPHHHPSRGVGCGVAEKCCGGEVWQITRHDAPWLHRLGAGDAKSLQGPGSGPAAPLRFCGQRISDRGMIAIPEHEHVAFDY